MNITPKSIQAQLDKVVSGQDDAKRAVALAGFLHYLRYSKATFEDTKQNHKKSNLLLLGPSGSGKTLLVRTLAEIINLPFLDVSATDLTPEGFVGASFNDFLQKYKEEHAYNSNTAMEHGIIFVDEIDKLAGRLSTTHHDDWHSSIQASLLKAVEGCTINFSANKQKELPGGSLDTHNLLFIFAGNFEGIRTTRTANKKPEMGFLGQPSDKLPAIQDELISHGIMPELVGRISLIAELSELTVDELYKILTTKDGNALESYKKLFEFYNYDIHVSDEELRQVAENCSKHKIGARGLQTELEKVLLECLYNVE